MIRVTKTYLPPLDEYIEILKRAWEKEWITNNGILVQELEQKLKETFGVEDLLYCGNGTIVIQMALKALGITKEVITTPFSYVATANAILWEGCRPVFVDINPDTFCIDADKIEEAITQDTEAILATHVYGLPCEVEKIQDIAKRHNLKVIYDAAHAFGAIYKGKSLLQYGDIATCSFHATKIFHTVEGGCVISHEAKLTAKLSLLRSFGHIHDEYFSVGINGKNSEFHAAMGLAMLPRIPSIIEERKRIFAIYEELLPSGLRRPNYKICDFEYNYSYLPVVVKDEATLTRVVQNMAAQDINVRRYFYPSLNQVPQTIHLNYSCPISEDISRRVVCLPLYVGLTRPDIELITNTLKNSL